ncbi:MAG: class I SAM-dependent methyltransferase [Bacteroidota bacterium]
MSTSKKEINNVHRSELYLYFYKDSLKSEKTKQQCNYIEEHCKLNGKEKILDLACGHGRHSIEFCKRNYRVKGIDINEEFINLAKKKSQEKGLDVQFSRVDILKTKYKNKFGVILFLFNSLGFFDGKDAKKIFKKINEGLVKGGKAFIDCKNRDHIIKEIKPYEVYEKGEDLMIDRLIFNPIKGTTTNNRIYIKDGKRYESPFTMYSYNYSDIERFLVGTELKIKKVLGGWKNEQFSSDSRRIILILEKTK